MELTEKQLAKKISNKKYYDTHHDELVIRRKPIDKAYYQRNKERLSALALERYYRLKALRASAPAPAPADPAPAPAPASGEA